VFDYLKKRLLPQQSEDSIEDWPKKSPEKTKDPALKLDLSNLKLHTSKTSLFSNMDKLVVSDK